MKREKSIKDSKAELHKDSIVMRTEFPEIQPPKQGKVRDIYELGDRLLIVATDRISAFDYILGSGIPDKGKVLTQLSAFWFRRTRGIVENHLISTDPAAFPSELAVLGSELAGRATL